LADQPSNVSSQLCGKTEGGSAEVIDTRDTFGRHLVPMKGLLKNATAANLNSTLRMLRTAFNFTHTGPAFGPRGKDLYMFTFQEPLERLTKALWQSSEFSKKPIKSKPKEPRDKDDLIVVEGSLVETKSERISAHNQLLLKRSRRLLLEVQRLVIEDFDFEGAKRILNRLAEIGETRRLLIELSSANPESEETPNFVIASEVLYSAYRKLCEIPTESILYAIGSRYGNVYTVERLVPLKLDKSEIAYASADLTTSSRILIDLEPYGSLLTCYFHAHPGRGAGANHPSDIDTNNHARLEKGDYRTVGGIFSRDGYLRFFTDKMPFKITISGKGVDSVGPNLWKLTSTENVPVCQSK